MGTGRSVAYAAEPAVYAEVKKPKKRFVLQAEGEREDDPYVNVYDDAKINGMIPCGGNASKPTGSGGGKRPRRRLADPPDLTGEDSLYANTGRVEPIPMKAQTRPSSDLAMVENELYGQLDDL